MIRFHQLKRKNKYTIAGFSDFGKVYQIQFWLHTIQYGYSEKGDTTELLIKTPKRQFIASIKLYGDKKFIIWEGFVYPDTSIFVKGEVWPAGDIRYLIRAKKSVFKKPLITNVDFSETQQTNLAFSKKED